MAGYYGYSMSNNAVEAYCRGEKPLSKWTKAYIVEELVLQGASSYLLESVKKIRLKELRKIALTKCGWHHTGLYFNKTDFYCVDITNMEDELVERAIENSKKKVEKNISTPEYRKVRYFLYSGTKKYPKKKQVIETCKVEGNWAYTMYGRKNIHANGFQFVN